MREHNILYLGSEFKRVTEDESEKILKSHPNVKCGDIISFVMKFKYDNEAFVYVGINSQNYNENRDLYIAKYRGIGEEYKPPIWTSEFEEQFVHTALIYLADEDFMNALIENKTAFDDEKQMLNETHDFAVKVHTALSEIKEFIHQMEIYNKKSFMYKDIEIEPYDTYGKGYEYYMIFDHNEGLNYGTQGEHTLVHLATLCANADVLRRETQQSKDSLQLYFEKNLLSIYFIKSSQSTEEYNNRFNCYSDWHKDCYGHRPHSESQDECIKEFLSKEGADGEAYLSYVKEENKDGREAMEYGQFCKDILYKQGEMDIEDDFDIRA